MGRRRSASNAVNIDDTLRWIGIRGEADGIDCRRKVHTSWPDDLVEMLGALAVVQADDVEFLEHFEVVLVRRYLPDPHLVDDADGLVAFGSPVAQCTNGEKIRGIPADGQEQIVFLFKMTPLNARIQDNRSVVGKLFGEGAAPSQQVEGWRQ